MSEHSVISPEQGIYFSLLSASSTLAFLASLCVRLNFQQFVGVVVFVFFFFWLLAYAAINTSCVNICKRFLINATAAVVLRCC